VIKQFVEGPNATDSFKRELAALQLPTRANKPVAPGVLANDPDWRVLVLEHPIHCDPVPDWLVGYAEALARLHAITGPDDAGSLPRRTGPTLQDVDSFLNLAKEFGEAVPPHLSTELNELVHRLAQTEKNALLHGDPCRETTCTPRRKFASWTSSRPLSETD
jgi:hypothetical protein